MRVSIFEGDKGFENVEQAAERGQSITVIFDGQEISDWHHASDGKDGDPSIIGMPKKNEDGSLWLDSEGFMRTVCRTGAIEIRIEGA